MNILHLTISALFGYLVAKFFSGKEAGVQGRAKSFRFSIGHYWFHLHHWIWAIMIIFLLIVLDFRNPFVLGFLIGLIIQGLTYSDFYKIIYRK